MIEYNNGLFHLKNSEISCLLRVTKYGHLEQVHFGSPVSTQDVQALACQPGSGWNWSVLLEDSDSESCMDTIPLAWSGSGRGDYRESPIELNGASTDFRYVSHRIFQGIQPMESGLPQAKNALQTLEITLEQPGARIYLYFTLFDTAITRHTVLENTGDAAIHMDKLMSTSMDLPGNYEITTFDGGWTSEMRKHTLPVLHSRVVNESVTGFSSHRHNPGFLLAEEEACEDFGRVYGFNLVYTGNHYASAQRSHQGLTRVMQGISPVNFHVELLPGQRFETPEAVLSYSDKGFAGLSANMHRFVNAHIVPAYWQGRPRPILYNNWEACMFNFDQPILVDLAEKAKELGCELFVLDDGWFGNRQDDRAGLGDYYVNPARLPEGLKPLVDKVNALGMSFGLWFEPESVNMDSDLYRAHPDWALTDDFAPVFCRHQLLLDLTKPEVRDYIVQSVTGVLDSANITYVKWDMNRQSVAQGAKAHAYILGLYEVLGRIFGPRPHILLESCSGGGNRFDLGMLCFGPQAWCSDDTDPIERLTIQGNLSYLYPQSTFGAHVSATPNAQTHRVTPLTTRGNVAFFGCLGYELDLHHLRPVEIQEIQAQIALYKQYRSVFQFGAFHRLKNGWQVSDGKVTLAGVYRRQTPAAPPYEQLRLKAMDPQKRYCFRTRPQGLRYSRFGELLKYMTPEYLDADGEVRQDIDRTITLPDAQQSFTATGAALQSGAMLLPVYRGAGYDANQRTELDYGSNLYIIEEE